MLVHAAKRAGEASAGRGGAPIIVRTGESVVSVCVRTAAHASRDLLAAGEHAGGDVTREDELLVFRLPTLAELRRRERLTRASSDSATSGAPRLRSASAPKRSGCTNELSSAIARW